MIANVSQRLIEFDGNLAESIALEEVKTQSITLVLGQGVQKSLDGRISDQAAHESTAFSSLPEAREICGSVKIQTRVEMPRL